MRERLASRAWLRALMLGVVALVLSVLSWWELLLAHPKTQNGDGQFFVEMVGAMRVSLLDFHELPLWNPYQCGGIPLWDNPQGISAAPMLWALLPFGTTRGIELWYILHSALGFVCMWLLARHELKLSLPVLPPVLADADYIEKVLCNLLENAAKYSPADTPIFLSATRRNDTVTVSVADRGLGIDLSEQELIFERFYRATTQSQRTSGTGMGLAISRAILEAHHGELTVTSQLGEGSVFSFTLPVAASS